MRIEVVTEVHERNDKMAGVVRRRLDGAQVRGVNVLGSPGAGKTSLLRAVAPRLGGHRVGVIEGDLASTVDTELLLADGIPAVQVNTGGDCHMSAAMVGTALDFLDLDRLDLVLVENVGNLICTAGVALGTHRTLVLASVPEGDDKPLKYPGIFAAADAIVVTKVDVLAAFDFDVERFASRVRVVNPGAPLWPVSARTGEGLDRLAAWMVCGAGS